MRLRLTLQQVRGGQVIPINYQHGLSAFIYKSISRADDNYANQLHTVGFRNGAKSFKFFNFSNLMIKQRKIMGDRLYVESETIDLIVNLAIHDILEKMVVGLFDNQDVLICDSMTRANFKVKFIEAIPEPEFRDTMQFKTISPIVVKRKEKGEDGSWYPDVNDDEYFELLKRNLEDKYIAFCKNTNEPIKEYSLSSMKIINRPLRKLVTLNSDRADKVAVRCYDYSFEISGDPEFLKFGYRMGFGANNSMGFGCVDVIRKIKN